MSRVMFAVDLFRYFRSRVFTIFVVIEVVALVPVVVLTSALMSEVVLRVPKEGLPAMMGAS